MSPPSLIRAAPGTSGDPATPPLRRLHDRAHAARLLAARLAPLRGLHPLVLAVPRGALPMARIIADALDAELDVVLAHKLGAPDDPEFAIGAVDESGRVLLGSAARHLGVNDAHIRQETDAQLAALRARAAVYRAMRPAVDPCGRVVVVVDDGVATGATLCAALESIRARGAGRLIAAVGVAPTATRAQLAAAADEVVCLLAPARMRAVSEFFATFPQVDDEDAVAALTGVRH